MEKMPTLRDLSLQRGHNNLQTSPPIRMINLGCGNRFHTDWVNVDIAPTHPSVIRCDLSCPIPFSEASFGVVYHSNVLEHIRPETAPTFIGECHRLLKPGGILRVAVPNLEQICRLYLLKLQHAITNEPDADEEYDWIVIELLDQCVRERSGGEMVRYLRRKPLPAVDFIIERIGNEGRQMLSQIHNEATRLGAMRQRVSWRQPCLRRAGSLPSPQRWANVADIASPLEKLRW